MNFKTTLIIFAVFILLGGGYLLFWKSEPDEAAQTEQPKISEAYGLEKDKIQRVRLSFRDESYQPLAMTKTADSMWQLTQPVKADADETKISEMLRNLLDKRVRRTMEVTDLAQYGLDQPNIQIELWTTRESPDRTFLIGNKGVSYSVYTREKSESHIFLIESSALDDFTKSSSDLRHRAVLKFSPDEVSGFSLQVSGQSEIRCRKRDESGWEMIEPVAAKADAKEIESMLSALDTLKVAVFEADGNVHPVQYGLDKPRIEVRLSSVDNKAQDLLVGADVGTTGRVYVRRADLDSVYAVNKEIYVELHKTVFDLHDKRVIDFQRTATTRFAIERRGEAKIACEKNADGEWKIKAPVQLKADTSAVDDLLFGVDALKAVEFVSDPPKSLQPYGLDAPSIQVSFMVRDVEAAVLLVGKTKGNNVYVKSQSTETVALVKKDFLDLVGMGVAGLRDKQVLDFDSDDAVKLVLRHGDVHLACQKQGTSWRLTHPVQEDAKNGAVSSMLYQINGLKVEKFLADVPNAATTGLDAPEIQVTVTLKDRTQHTLQIGKPDESEHLYARLGHSSNTIFLLKGEVADALKKTVEDLRATSDGA